MGTLINQRVEWYGMQNSHTVDHPALARCFVANTSGGMSIIHANRFNLAHKIHVALMARSGVDATSQVVPLCRLEIVVVALQCWF